MRRPTGFLPTEDQGYAVLLAKLPDGASQPRVHRVSEQIETILEKRGLAGWVDIGGYSILDAAAVSTVITVFVVYDDWSKRGRDLTQEKIVAGLNRDLFVHPGRDCLRRDSSADQGLSPTYAVSASKENFIGCEPDRRDVSN